MEDSLGGSDIRASSRPVLEGVRYGRYNVQAGREIGKVDSDTALYILGRGIDHGGDCGGSID